MRRVFIILLLGLTLVTVALGQTKIIKLKTGTEFKGEVAPTADGTSYRIQLPSGGLIVVRKDQVVSIEPFVAPRQEYQNRLAKIDPNSPDDRYRLAEWAAANDLLDEAREQLQEVTKLAPDHVRSLLLLRQVEKRIADRQIEIRPERPTTNGRPVVVGGLGDAGLKTEWLLNADDISRIRLEELRPTDRVPIRFENDVLRRFIRAMEGRKEFRQPGFEGVFMGYSNVAKAMYILENVDRDNSSIKDDIIIRSDPQFMVDFRSRIWPTVAQRCAGSQCHGQDKAVGGLKLFNIMLRNERLDYTNFLILDTFERPAGRKMINRNDPDSSLLLQYGLPPEQARRKHPTQIPVMFTSRDAAAFKRIVEWIESLQRPLHPNYRLRWRPPFGMKLNLTGRTKLPIAPAEPEEAERGDESDEAPPPGG